jgi:hypothetical protein
VADIPFATAQKSENKLGSQQQPTALNAEQLLIIPIKLNSNFACLFRQ